MATSAVETAKQENGSRYFLESVIERGVTPDWREMRKIYDSYDASWKSTYEKQTVAVQKFLGIRKGYTYSRDDGIMPMIEEIAKTECGVSVKDRWNPMDIVLVKKSMRDVVEGTIKELTNIDGMSKDAKLELLNAYMRETLNDKVLIGISLKAIKENKKVATQELANMAKGSARTTIEYEPKSLKCNLTLGKKANYLFDTGELGFDLETESGGSIHGQARNFQYSKARNVVQTDLTPKGKDAGAKLGKVSSVALDGFLESINLQRPPSASRHLHIPAVGTWKKTDIDFWVNLYNEIKDAKVGGESIDFGEVAVYQDRQKVGEGIETVIKTAIKYETENKDRSSGGRFSSKLIALEWAKIWVEIDKKKKLKEWCTSLYYGAKKEFSSKNGPFLKIY
tara:strand:- start:2840 stop:4024 length:1185 start_codon:yes stop_codon:yes gene_type:complete